MERLALFGGILLLSACGGKTTDEDDRDYGDGFQDDGSGGLLEEVEPDTGFEASVDAPKILSADVSCDYSEC